MTAEDKFTEEVYSTFTSRKQILRRLHKHIEDNKSFNDLVLAGIVMLYAHFEGFLKSSIEIYLNYVCKKKHRSIKDLNANLQARAMKKLFVTYCADLTNIVNLGEFISKIDTNIDINLSVDFDRTVYTKSNVSSEVLINILKSAGLQTNTISSNTKLMHSVDELVDARNQIAHNGFKKLDFAIYSGLYNDILQAIEELNTLITNTIVTKDYNMS